MLAKSSPPFNSENHIFELKWDGTRCIAFIDRENLILQNRRLIDITHRYPEFQQLKKYLKAKEAVLDGELVVLKEGLPSFEKLQQREHIEDEKRIKILSELLPATYIVFDLLYIDGIFIMDRPLIERRERLSRIFPLSENVILSEIFFEGKELFKKALKMGFEGIMAKEKKSPYLPGERSNYWLKVKKFFDLDAIICGYIEGEGIRKDYFGSLVLGVYDNKRLIHIGQVGTGIDESTMKNLFNILKEKRTDKSPFDTLPKFEKKVYWCKPEIVVKIRYHELTKDKKLRVPIFKGIRFDKEPDECII
jgi:bifunctional non-homologous end joining protein LigD